MLPSLAYSLYFLPRHGKLQCIKSVHALETGSDPTAKGPLLCEIC